MSTGWPCASAAVAFSTRSTPDPRVVSWRCVRSLPRGRKFRIMRGAAEPPRSADTFIAAVGEGAARFVFTRAGPIRASVSTAPPKSAGRRCSSTRAESSSLSTSPTCASHASARDENAVGQGACVAKFSTHHHKVVVDIGLGARERGRSRGGAFRRMRGATEVNELSRERLGARGGVQYISRARAAVRST